MASSTYYSRIALGHLAGTMTVVPRATLVLGAALMGAGPGCGHDSSSSGSGQAAAGAPNEGMPGVGRTVAGSGGTAPVSGGTDVRDPGPGESSAGASQTPSPLTGGASVSGGTSAAGGSATGGGDTTGGQPSIPEWKQCAAYNVGIDSIGCFECCLRLFPDLPEQNTEEFCICVSPRPCGTACDAAHCGPEKDLSKETSECFQCRLELSGSDVCDDNYDCEGDPYCKAATDCYGQCL